jgi:nicotinate-nucleotide adenylyltransferase
LPKKELAVLRIGVYGGTFNPPHLGHMTSARAAIGALGLEKLLFIPAAAPPHKVLPEGSAGPLERLDMAALMADGLDAEPGQRCAVRADDVELRRAGKSYTADTLAELRALHPEDELWLLMGSDMFLSLQSWREPERITALAGIAAFAREEGDSLAVMERQAVRLREDFGARVALVPLPKVTQLSSTELRAALAEGEGGENLWTQVYGYILLRGLYRVGKDLRALCDQDLRSASYSMIQAKRVPHIQGTEAAAAALAERWGADVEKARRAAILHDCTKYLRAEEQLALCAHWGEELDELERSAVKLLHSKTGAWIARETFGVDDEIFGAIYWHTTGKADMTLLEKVVYLADYTEPTREFRGVEELRALAEKSLDAALLLGFEMSIREMHERGLPVHHRTEEARAWMLARRSKAT